FDEPRHGRRRRRRRPPRRRPRLFVSGEPADPERDLREAWRMNAANWTRAVREGRIESRETATNAAIVAAVLAEAPSKVIDLGCGEGWLSRDLRAKGVAHVIGVDASPELIAAAQSADPGGEYVAAAYDDLGKAIDLTKGRFDIACFNFALLDSDAVTPLRAAAGLLETAGAILIQTVPPGAASAAEEGWRSEDFAAFGDGDWAPMPWFARSMAGWRTAAARAGLAVDGEDIISGPDGPLSLLLTCRLG
ncbi:MAG: class I SAM-dependent methyltransferase, partial [Pseudomonadota bacterium]